jgi:sortase B
MSDSAQPDNENTEVEADRACGPRHAKTDDPAGAKKKPLVILLSVVLAALIVGVGVGYLIWQQHQLDRAVQEARQTPVPAIGNSLKPALEAGPAPQGEALVENPIDFPALKVANPNIYAWLYVPGTDVNHPVLQHPNNDFYYLTHNRDDQASPEGALYSQLANSTDFSDPVTLIYGHNMVNNGMFATLHYFENADFFAANDKFYLYTPTRILTYRVVSAYLYDDRHILNSFDFSDSQTLEDYLAFVQNPDALIANARDGVRLSPDDRVVQLSTCMSDWAYSNSRFLVNGVLVDEQPTS